MLHFGMIALATVALSFGATLSILDSQSPSAPPSVFIAPKLVPTAKVTNLDELPELPENQSFSDDWDGNYAIRWHGIDGLHATKVKSWSLIKARPAIEITPSPIESLHRLGIRAEELPAGLSFQVGFWIRATPGTKIHLELRDLRAQNSGSASFDLSNRVVTSSVGAVRGSAFELSTDQWYKASAKIAIADRGLIAYLGLLDSAGATVFKGDGRSVVLLGGMEIAPSFRL